MNWECCESIILSFHIPTNVSKSLYIKQFTSLMYNNSNEI